MNPITLEVLWIVICIIIASGGVVFAVFTLFNTATERIAKIETRVGSLENSYQNTEHQTTELFTTVKDIQENVNDIRISQTEMRVTLTGSDGKNGLRGEFRELKMELKELLNKL